MLCERWAGEKPVRDRFPKKSFVNRCITTILGPVRTIHLPLVETVLEVQPRVTCCKVRCFFKASVSGICLRPLLSESGSDVQVKFVGNTTRRAKRRFSDHR